MAIGKFEQSLADGVHHMLSSLEGEWEGQAKTWFEPGILADESSMKGKIAVVLGGRFLSYDYRGSLEGKAFEGKMIIGFNLPYQKINICWVDSFHMGTQMMPSTGTAKENGFSVLGSYGSPEYDQPWGWKTELEIKSADEIIFTAYNISPEGEEAKATETVYKRIS